MKRLATSFALLSALLSCQAADIILLLAPEAGAPVVARVDSNHPAILEASDVLSAEPGNSTWQWTEYQTTIEGYVSTTSVGKNFALQAGSLIRAKASPSAAVLTVAEDGDNYNVLASDATWTKVRFTKEVPVYFSRVPQLGLTSLSEIEPVSPAPQIKPTPEPAPQRSPRKTAGFDPDASVGIRELDELPPENVVWRSASPQQAPTAIDSTPVERAAPALAQSPSRPTSTDNIIVDANITSDRAAPRSPALSQGIPTRTMTGRLIRKHSASGPRYPLRLQSQSGARIAYIDMSNVFVSDLRPYLEQQVYISGEVRPLVPGSRELVIVARTIRLSN